MKESNAKSPISVVEDTPGMDEHVHQALLALRADFQRGVSRVDKQINAINDRIEEHLESYATDEENNTDGH